MPKIQSTGTRSKCSWIIRFSAIALFLLLAPAVFVQRQRAPQVSAYWIVGYYEGVGSPPIANIPWSKYTQIDVEFFGQNSDCTITNSHAGSETDLQTLITAAHANNVKILYSIGDQVAGYNYLPTCTDSTHLSGFVTIMVNYMNGAPGRTVAFDGIDLDWEGSDVASQHVNWINALRAALPSGKLLTDAAPDNISTALQTYTQLDQINLGCYDEDWNHAATYYNSWIYFANFTLGEKSCDYGVGQYTTAGVPAAKIGVGLPFYAHRWTGVTQPLQTGGTFIGTIWYSALVNDPVRWQNAYKNLDTTHYAQYLSIPGLNEFISYTDQTQIQEYVRWGKSQGFGGFFSYSITEEYLSGQSTVETQFPLSTALWNDVTGGVRPSTTSPSVPTDLTAKPSAEPTD